MRFSASSIELQKILGNIGGVIPARSTVPILENFLFEISDNRLLVTATDLDTSMTVNLPVKSGENGTVAVPAKRLMETVRALPNTDINFSSTPDNNKILMKTANGEYRLTGESGENYPAVPKFKADTELNIGGETLTRLITKTSFAVSSDELRPSMMGVLFQIKKNEIRAVATDGHRLVRVINSSFTSSVGEREVVIPAKALNLVLKSSDDSQSSVSFNENHALFSMGTTRLISRMIEEKFPNYESVIPLENNKELLVDKNLLLSSVRRTALYASSTTHQVRFSLKKGSLTVSAEDIDFGSEARETLPCEYSSEAMEIGFNSSYMIDMLSHVDTDQVQLMFSSPTRASILRPVTQREGENVLMLVMPVRLSD
jgi:DNA polymerase III subunit beta